MIRPFRCLNCTEFPRQHEFYVDDTKPIACPTCKLAFAELPDCFQPLTIIHFDPPHPVAKNRGTKRRACEPKKYSFLQEPDLVHAASGHAGSVTCPECRKTPQYLQAIASMKKEDVWRPFDEVDSGPSSEPGAGEVTSPDAPNKPTPGGGEVASPVAPLEPSPAP